MWDFIIPDGHPFYQERYAVWGVELRLGWVAGFCLPYVVGVYRLVNRINNVWVGRPDSVYSL